MLAVPGSPDTQVAAELAALIERAHPGHTVQVADLGSLSVGPSAVVVPLVTGPHPALDAATGTAAMLAAPLGPHPLLANALHDRLAESGLARADRVRMLTMVSAADGIIVVTAGGQAAVADAEVTSVLLASRLAIPVMTVALDGGPTVADAADRLRKAGTARVALAPCLIGPEADLRALIAEAAAAGAACAEPLGAHPALAQLIVLRYVEALEKAWAEES